MPGWQSMQPTLRPREFSSSSGFPFLMNISAGSLIRCRPEKSPDLSAGALFATNDDLLVVAAGIHLDRAADARIRIAAVLGVKVRRVGALPATIGRRVIAGKD